MFPSHPLHEMGGLTNTAIHHTIFLSLSREIHMGLIQSIEPRDIDKAHIYAGWSTGQLPSTKGVVHRVNDSQQIELFPIRNAVKRKWRLSRCNNIYRNYKGTLIEEIRN